MSEDDARPTAPAADESLAPASFGARLTAARERAGITVTEVAARLRLHPKQVRALEEENLGALPEPAYVRGFLRSYARLVGIDSAALVKDLNAKMTPPTGSVVDGMVGTQDYSPVKAAAQEQASRMFVLGLAVLALIALGAIGWYATRQAADAPPAPPASSSAAPAPAASAVPAETPAPVADAAAPPSEASVPVAGAAGAATPLLTLHFNGVSWVEVTDANGKVLLSQLARSGEIHQPSGTPPLAVVIGDASKAIVTVRGEPMNLEPIARANVARFTVK